MICVIGSGPSGVAVTKALLDQGLAVTMLDAGIGLEEDKAALLDSLEGIRPEEWRGVIRDAWHSELQPGQTPKKLCYGSDFAYRDADQRIAVRAKGVRVNASFALGGLSNVWGAAILPFRVEDMAAWPLVTRDLGPHYRAVFEMMPLAGSTDHLSGDLPLWGEASLELKLGRQAEALVSDLVARRQLLAGKGIQFGGARLAIHDHRPDCQGQGDGAACCNCGLCLRGCPRRLIYNSASSVRSFQANPNFRYIGNFVVDDVSEEEGRVFVSGRRGGVPERLSAGRAYVACGTLGTARVMLGSMGAFGRRFMIKDSQYFLLPFLRFAGSGPVRQEATFTLSQLFMELDQRVTGAHPVHLQFYGYNDMYLEMLQQRLGILARWAKPLLDAFLDRLMMIQGYLHSDDSSAIEAVLERRGSSGILTLNAAENPGARAVVSTVTRRLSAIRSSLRGQVLSPLLQFGIPGEGSHIGGLFPMRDCPAEFEADTLGRIRGFERVHVVDASVLPSIPATTVTLPVMANAHRIGSLYRHVANEH